MEQDIYEYVSDIKGTKKFGDPILLIRRLNQSLAGDDLSQLFKNCQLDPANEFSKKLIDDSEARLLKLSREVFKIKPIDEDTGEGLTEVKSIQLLVDFCIWLGELKKNTEPPVNSPTPTQDISVASASPTS